MVTFEITVSLDGFVAGPNASLEHPLGEGGERLHDWAYALASWRESHGLDGGERNQDDELVRESLARQGAVVMGRRMFSGGKGPWRDDPNANGWWGDEPPFGVPVFVLTHHAREPLVLGATTFTFVTDGIEAALEHARAAAGERDVAVAGGADVVQQCLRAGLVDEFELHVAPLLLGDGVRLFGSLGAQPPSVEMLRALSSPNVAHLRYRVLRVGFEEPSRGRTARVAADHHEGGHRC
jgi:dihydrofolate reductase